MRSGVLLILAGLLAACATPQTPHAWPGAAEAGQAPGQGRPASCPDTATLGARALYGAWDVELPQAGLRGQLVLKAHPEFSESLRGEFRLNGRNSIASGDVEAGELNLDESRDGKTLHAFWSGHLVRAACGREIRGTWQPVPREGATADPESDFVLRRTDAGRW